MTRADEPLEASQASFRGGPVGQAATFGRYLLQEEVGRGGMGVVYRAHDRDTGAEVALKLLLAPGGLDPRDVSRLELEAKILARVSHVGIVSVRDAGMVGGVPFIALSFVRGAPLSRLTFGLAEHVTLLAKIARALGAAHRASIVHRDLKPSNVLVEDGTGEPRVVDFGLAFDAHRAAARLSQTGEILGTPAYMAPETIGGKARPDDPRLDVYALGVMLHERLDGAHPFFVRGRPLNEIMASIVKGAPSLVGKPGVDPVLAALAARATAVDPERRPRNGDAFAVELEAWLRGPKKAAPRGSRRALALIPVALALAVSGAFLLRGKTPPAPVAPPPRPEARPEAPPVVAALPAEASPEQWQPLEELLSATRGATGSDAVFHQIMDRARSLAERYPADSRVLRAIAWTGIGTSGEEHTGRRALVRLFVTDQALTASEIDRSGRACHMLGFERAAADVAERTFRGAAAPPAEFGAFLCQLYLGAMPPVSWPERGTHLSERLLRQKTEANAQSYPASSMLHAHIATGFLAASNHEGAAREYEEAAKLALPEEGHGLRELVRAARMGAIEARDSWRLVRIYLASTPFFVRAAEADDLALQSRDQEAAHAFEELADEEIRAGHLENAACALLRAARYNGTSGAHDAVRADLRRALALDLPGAPDTRALVCRAAARDLLEKAPDPARAEALARESVAPVKGFDPRLPGEIADGWALVARARLAVGDTAGAREALQKGIALAPHDRRELESLARQAR